MKLILILILLTVPSLCYAQLDDMKLPDLRLPKLGEERKDHRDSRRNDKLQIYKDHVPQVGDYYKRKGNKWQRYEDHVPKIGEHLKKR